MDARRVPQELWEQVALYAAKIDTLALSDALVGVCYLEPPSLIIQAPYAVPVLQGHNPEVPSMILQVQWATLATPELSVDQYEWLLTRLPGALTHTQLELGGCLRVLKALQAAGDYRREMTRPHALDRASHRGHLALFKWLAGPKYVANPSDMAYAFVSRNRPIIAWIWKRLSWNNQSNSDVEVLAFGLGMSADLELIQEYGTKIRLDQQSFFHKGLIYGLAIPCYPEREQEAVGILRTLYVTRGDTPPLFGDLSVDETHAISVSLLGGCSVAGCVDIMEEASTISSSQDSRAIYAMASISKNMDALRVLSRKNIPDRTHALVGAVANAAMYPNDQELAAFVQLLLTEGFPLTSSLWPMAALWSSRTRGSTQSRSLLRMLSAAGLHVPASALEAAAYGGDVDTCRFLVDDLRAPWYDLRRLILFAAMAEVTEDQKIELLAYLYSLYLGPQPFLVVYDLQQYVPRTKEYRVFRWLMEHYAFPCDMADMIPATPLEVIISMAHLLSPPLVDRLLPPPLVDRFLILLILCARHGRSDIAAYLFETLSAQPLEDIQLAQLAIPAIVHGHLPFLAWLEGLASNPQSLCSTISVETHHRRTREWALQHGHAPTTVNSPWRMSATIRLHSGEEGNYATLSPVGLNQWGNVTREPLSDTPTRSQHRFYCETNAKTHAAIHIIRGFY